MSSQLWPYIRFKLRFRSVPLAVWVRRADQHDPYQRVFRRPCKGAGETAQKGGSEKKTEGTSVGSHRADVQGADFVDHMIVTVRGGRILAEAASIWAHDPGKGGNGSAAFAPSRSGGLGPPSGGNGGPGGSVYLTTSPTLTSLASVPKRLIGSPGGSGAGNWKNGRRGEDVIVRVPVGTVVKELKRDPEAERIARDEEAEGLSREERHVRRRERWFVKHPMMETWAEEDRDVEFSYAEEHLRDEGFFRRTPSFEEEPALEEDITRPLSEPILLSRGGRGGLGNPHFSMPSSARYPRLASRGAQPATLTFSLELKLLADVGLVGFPNAGKSTILRALTGRRAEVAGYEFTTLNPQVGVVRVHDDGSWQGEGEVVEETEIEREKERATRSSGEYMPTLKELNPNGAQSKAIERIRFTVSDNPGLLPMASQNVGLGHSFLRSIERSLALAFVLDLRRPDPVADLQTLQKELEEYQPGLSDKGAVVVLNKADEVDEEQGKEKLEAMRGALKGKMEVIVASGKWGLGLKRLVALLADRVDAARTRAKEDEEWADDL